MKKSFLSRAMSAAIAVPVALSQTLVVASFAVDDNAVNASGLQTITIENFKQVPVADSELSPITEVEKYAKYEKYSTWNTTLKAWTFSQAGQTYTLDISKLTESLLTSDAWYVDMLEDIVNNPEYVSATAEIGLDDVTMVLDVDYPYEVAIKDILQKQFAEKYPDVELDFKSDSALDLTVTIKAATTALDDSKIPFEVTILDGDGNKLETVDAVADYIISTIEQIRVDANKMIDDVVADYQKQLDDAQALKDEKQQLKNEKQAEKDAKVIEVDEKQDEKDSKQAEVVEKQANVNAKQAELNDAIANGGDIASARKELSDARAQLRDAQDKLDDAQAQLDDAREKLDDAQAQLDDAQTQLDDAQRQINEAQQQLNESETMAEGEIDNMIDGYIEKIEAAKDRYNGFTGEYSGEYSGANVDEALQKAKSTLKDKFPGQANRIDRIPNSVDDFANSNMYGKLVSVYAEVLNQINAQTQDKAYDIAITVDDVLDFAKEIYDVTISGDVVKTESGYVEASGKVEGSLPEELTTDDLAYYYDYFNELFAPDNKKVKEGSLKTEKVMGASGNGVSDTLSGEATLEIKRVITLEVEDLEETTTSETTTSSDETTTVDPSQTTTIDPSQTTTIDPSQTTTIDPSQTTTIDPSQTTTIDRSQRSRRG
ncbi:MAG: hypothetical protein K2H66_04585, partial [Oscillospiraceae bacterium]|nr:hypothetical protein [Oscillospiraceae bacterium]